MTNEEIERELGHLATKEGLADLRADIAKCETRMIKWMIALILPIYAILFALILTLVPHLK